MRFTGKVWGLWENNWRGGDVVDFDRNAIYASMKLSAKNNWVFPLLSYYFFTQRPGQEK